MVNSFKKDTVLEKRKEKRKRVKSSFSPPDLRAFLQFPVLDKLINPY